MSKVLILGRGPSLDYLKNIDFDSINSIILMNNHEKTLLDDDILNKLRSKDVYVMCNINQAGFVPGVLQKLDVKSCLTNRLKPNWDLWREHKNKQIKHNAGGTLNNLSYLPYIAEDEPYLYVWRGPEGKNKNNMKTYDGRLIEHMPEDAEKYLISVYNNNLVCNCSYYGTLYAIIKLAATEIIYCGLDFYNNLKIDKKWFVSPPPYLSSQWWNLRVKYEGEHMKVLWDEYLSSFFPDVDFMFYTTADLDFKSTNIKHTKVESADSSKTYR